MKLQPLKYWDLVRTSFWFVPSFLAAGATGLASAAVALDRAVTDEQIRSLGWWVYTGDAEGASVVLGTIAGSMITIAGVVFSMTLVALSLASSQLGPRLLRNFMRDTTNQVVLGTFIATFVYCLLVLRTIRRNEPLEFVPQLSVTGSVLLALISLALLIYFIHHVSVSIQANEVVARVGEELLEGIDRLFPEHIGQEKPRLADEPPSACMPETFEREASPVGSAADGYLQLIDAAELMKLAMREDLLLRIELKPGHYAVKGRPLLLAWPGDRVSEALRAGLHSAFVLGKHRTTIQDAEFAVHQLVEVAVRALSPGINDPFTAVACVDRLASGLCRLVQRNTPSPYRFDELGRLRVVAAPNPLSGIVDAAFDQIRQHARSSAAVSIRLMETIVEIARVVQRPADRITFQRHADMIARGAREGLPEPEDRRAVEVRYQAATQALQERDAVPTESRSLS